MSVSGLPDWVVASYMELFGMIEDPEDRILSTMSNDLLSLVAPFVDTSPLCALDRFILDFYASGGS